MEPGFSTPVAAGAGRCRLATELYAGSLVTAKVTVNAMVKHSPNQVTLVAMGKDGISRADEDEFDDVTAPAGGFARSSPPRERAGKRNTRAET
jgi:hypothetical protein